MTAFGSATAMIGALRGVADRMLGVLIVMLSTGTLYDPARRATRAA
jgi:hypothetical protein